MALEMALKGVEIYKALHLTFTTIFLHFITINDLLLVFSNCTIYFKITNSISCCMANYERKKIV